jgi:branched-chain amino acid transport system substrate-binding protein
VKGRALAAFATLIVVAVACSGSATAPSDQGSTKVGLVVSLTGAGSASAALAIQGATVAVAQANVAHLGGKKQLVLVKADDESGPDGAGRACSRLVSNDHVVTIVGLESTAAINACSRAISAANVPYFAAVPSGQDVCLANVFVFGFTPNQQVSPLIDFLARKQSAKRFYIMASDQPPAQDSFRLAALKIQGGGGALVGTLYRPAGTVQFGSDIAAIAAARPDVVLIGLVAGDEVAFQRQFRSDPRVAGIKEASLFLNTATARSIGPAAVGVFVSQDFNSADTSPATQAWLTALLSKFGDGAVPSAIGAEVYDATLFAANAISRAQSTSGEAIATAAAAVSIEGPRGTIQLMPGEHGYATVSTHVGQVNAALGIDVLEISNLVSPIACKGD